MKMRYVSDCTVVRLEDGRIGWKGVNTPDTRGRNLILFADHSGEELQPDKEVEVVKYPAQLAREYVESIAPTSGE